MTQRGSARMAQVQAWLTRPGQPLEDTGAVVGGVCESLLAAGLPLRRANLAMQTLHPELVGVGYTWRRGSGPPRLLRLPRGETSSERYLRSPLPLVFEQKLTVRRRLEGEGRVLDFPILEELRAEGMTDYIMLPIVFTQGQVQALSLAVDAPGGFTDEEVLGLEALMPLLSLQLEVQATRRMAADLLGIYLGRQTGEQVLRGRVVRGEVESLEAALWYCDLRDFTGISARLSPVALVELLNTYFDCMAEAVHAQGGEILKFIGDAMLAIFPITTEAERAQACRRALEAAQQAEQRLEALSATLAAAQRLCPQGDIALHVGRVVYGNIGARQRLDFTVIGSAVNLVTRLESLCGELGRSLVFSRDFARQLDTPVAALGTFRLKGVPEPQEIFAPATAG